MINERGTEIVLILQAMVRVVEYKKIKIVARRVNVMNAKVHFK